MILTLEHIFKSYQQGKMDVPVLKDISLEVDDGEYIAIMGPSGSGKTTLMNIIGCLDTATSGTYRLVDRNLKKLSENRCADIRNKYIGFVFQNYYLFPKMTALDNVALPLIYAGVGKKERRQRATEALEKVGLGDRLKFKPNQLSGGQCQRVAIARAIVTKPVLLLADEPTGALDSRSGEQVMNLFYQLNQEGTAIVMITHDQNIANHAEKIYYIKDGEIGTGKELGA